MLRQILVHPVQKPLVSTAALQGVKPRCWSQHYLRWTWDLLHSLVITVLQSVIYFSFTAFSKISLLNKSYFREYVSSIIYRAELKQDGKCCSSISAKYKWNCCRIQGCMTPTLSCLWAELCYNNILFCWYLNSLSNLYNLLIAFPIWLGALWCYAVLYCLILKKETRVWCQLFTFGQ